MFSCQIKFQSSQHFYLNESKPITPIARRLSLFYLSRHLIHSSSPFMAYTVIYRHYCYCRCRCFGYITPNGLSLRRVLRSPNGTEHLTRSLSAIVCCCCGSQEKRKKEEEFIHSDTSILIHTNYIRRDPRG